MSDTKESKRGFRWRTFASLCTSWFFLILGLTGLVLYTVPQGRIAYWVDWRFLGLTKTDWGNIHVVTSVLFLAAGGWHLYFNWKAFLGHLRRRIARGIRVRRELLITTAFAALVTVSALWHIPPLGYLIDLNEAIKSSWIESEDYEPPFGHAELVSLEKLCRKTDIDPEKAFAELERLGLRVESSSQTLEEIAVVNETSPKAIFAVIKPFQRRPEPVPGGRLTADDVLDRFEGTGLGRKTIADACEIGGDRIERCLARLTTGGVRAEPDEKIRQVGLRAEIKPIKVLQMMLVDP